jgi:hypothetical protein
MDGLTPNLSEQIQTAPLPPYLSAYVSHTCDCNYHDEDDDKAGMSLFVLRFIISTVNRAHRDGWSNNGRCQRPDHSITINYIRNIY